MAAAARRPPDADHPRPPHARDRPGLHPRVPVLPGGHGLAARPGAGPRPSGSHGRGDASGDRAQRAVAAFAERRRLQPDRAPAHRAHGALPGTAGRHRAPLHAGGDPHPAPDGADPARPQDELHAGARGGDAAPSERDQQREYGGGPDGDGSAGLRRGLEVRQALLHDRAPDGNRNGHAGHRGVGL